VRRIFGDRRSARATTQDLRVDPGGAAVGDGRPASAVKIRGRQLRNIVLSVTILAGDQPHTYTYTRRTGTFMDVC